MKVDLKEVAFHGEWCSESDPEYKVTNWFEKSSMQFFYTGKLIDEFGYKDCDEIELSGHFIPVFKTDVVALKKEFVAAFYSREVEEEILMIMERNKNRHRNFTGYDVAFKIFCEEHEDFWDAYWDYERGRLLEDAEKWCKENSIPYYLPDDPERKLDLSDTLLYGYGGETRDRKGRWKKFDFWFYKKEFRFMDPSDIKATFGYKTDEEIISSGFFVLFPRIKPEIIEANYIADSRGTKTEDDVKRFMAENQSYSYEEALKYLSHHTEKFIKIRLRYNKTQLLKYAEQWAIKNYIPYYIPKDRPDHLGSQFREE